MSILIALKSGGRVYIGGDRESMQDGSIETDTSRVWEPYDAKGFVIGCIGSVKVISALKNRSLFQYYDNYLNYSFTKTYLPRRIADAIKDLSNDEEAYFEDERGVWELNAAFLIASHNRLFYMNQRGEIVEIEDFCVLGDDMSFAYDSLRATGDIADPIERIKRAVAASVGNKVDIEYPVSVCRTYTKSPRRWGGKRSKAPEIISSEVAAFNEADFK